MLALIILDYLIVHPAIQVTPQLPITPDSVPTAMIQTADGVTRISITVD